MNWISSVIAVGLTIAIYIAVPAVSRAMDRLWLASAHLAQPVGLAEAIVFCIAFALAAIPSIVYSVPLSVQSDEISYLLNADTFAHGRLTNPPHALPELFETAETIQTPTYASKYPPAQGLVMALPLRWFGLPIVGVWISGAIACAAVVWMLRAIVPRAQPQWTLIGGLLAAAHPLIASWNQSYWGGNVAMIGGALLLGAAFRFARFARARQAVIAGAGLSILALSRPFEGAIVGIIAIALLLLLVRFPIRRLIASAAWLALALTPTLIFLGYYNQRVTGDWKLFPHELYERQYRTIPRFFWQKPRPEPAYHSQIVRDMAMYDYPEYAAHLGPANYIGMVTLKIGKLIAEYLFPPTVLLAAIVSAFVIARGREFQNRLLWIALAVVVLLPLLHLAMVPITRMPYFAPGFAAIFVLIIAGARAAARRLGPAIVVAVMLVAQFTACFAQMPKLNRVSHPDIVMNRAHDVARLKRLPGKKLVLVRYPPGFVPPFDFVFNDADIDGSKVVFARSIDGQHDHEAVELFHDRAPWLLDFDAQHYSLEPMSR